MEPNISLNFGAIAVSIIVAFFIGYLWYGPVFGKVWAKAMGYPEDYEPDGSQMIKAIVLQVVGLTLITFVMANTTQVWRPSTWGLSPDAPDWFYGINASVFTWLGFFIPVLLSAVAWENKPWKVFFLNAAYYLVNLTVIAMILNYWR